MKPRHSKIRILVVEDEIVVSEDLQQRLAALGYDVVGATDTADVAIQFATALHPDVILMDIMLHGRPKGIEAAQHIRSELDIPVIYLTAHSDTATLQKASVTEPAGYIVKPFEDNQLRVAIELAPSRHEMGRQAERVARWLKATLTSLGDAVISTNANGEILFLNPAAEKLIGWTQNNAAGKSCAEVVRLTNQLTGQILEDSAILALRFGRVVYGDLDTVLTTATDEERFVDYSASPIIDEQGKISGAVVVLVDATDRVAAQNRVQGLTRQVMELLAEKDKQEVLGDDLEAFAAAVSHDLRAPLRAISGYGSLLAESSRDQLDATGQHFLDRVRTSAQQMSSMVEDYLLFLGSGRRQLPRFAAVDMTQLAQQVFADLTKWPDQNPVRFVCETLPQAWGDLPMLRQVLVNLLSNALKYSAKQALSVVEVGALSDHVASENFHTFYVRDNGAGLDLPSATKLFEPFQRFHSMAEFTGTGVGLAIVKRIVERHGGRIWAESEPGAGATFFFSLLAKARVESQQV